LNDVEKEFSEALTAHYRASWPSDADITVMLREVGYGTVVIDVANKLVR